MNQPDHISVSLAKLLGLPDAAIAFLISLSVILALAPYTEGYDLGIVKIPRLSEKDKKRLRRVGPTALALLIFAMIPIWPSQTDSGPKQNQTAIEDVSRGGQPEGQESLGAEEHKQNSKRSRPSEAAHEAKPVAEELLAKPGPQTLQAIHLTPGLQRRNPESSPCYTRTGFTKKKLKRAGQDDAYVGYTYDAEESEISFYWYCFNNAEEALFYYFCCSCRNSDATSIGIYASGSRFNLRVEDGADYAYSVDCDSDAPGHPPLHVARASEP